MMEKLNLLPWRDLQRQAYRQQFYALIAAACLVAAAGVGGAHVYLTGQQAQQQGRNQQLEQAIAALEHQLSLLPKLERQRLAFRERLAVIKDIQQERNQVTHLLNLLPTLVPQGVYLNQVTLAARRVTLEGEGDSNGQLAMLLSRAEHSPWLSDVAIHSIVVAGGEDEPATIAFNASFVLAPPQAGETGSTAQGETP
ncbi:PilN domain-containing protein [Photobacterium atrarenae]|uniref:PilN domain-containing protein n=1 Tax=Photobacterium atrarenae TaxID=865757 RepID=A0ABY5GGL7_9GAMM|nr:PilN domain-containing protein [Photobacterium atrarenae]UTV27955.1 PilN domain-containing protein [Photobacterium atrarenae]